MEKKFQTLGISYKVFQQEFQASKSPQSTQNPSSKTNDVNLKKTSSPHSMSPDELSLLKSEVQIKLKK